MLTTPLLPLEDATTVAAALDKQGIDWRSPEGVRDAIVQDLYRVEENEPLILTEADLRLILTAYGDGPHHDPQAAFWVARHPHVPLDWAEDMVTRAPRAQNAPPLTPESSPMNAVYGLSENTAIPADMAQHLGRRFKTNTLMVLNLAVHPSATPSMIERAYQCIAPGGIVFSALGELEPLLRHPSSSPVLAAEFIDFVTPILGAPDAWPTHGEYPGWVDQTTRARLAGMIADPDWKWAHMVDEYLLTTALLVAVAS